ncbi:hypothetical protein [Brevibacillus porteri]|uniref:hypothetical protein n=1 Tax=Brevibacillus porteri TaxID=2126350 RepID=UPI003D1A572D
MSFNEKLPEWLAPGTEPPESKKVSGWAPADKPPADYFNWLFHRAYLVLKELQQNAYDKRDPLSIDDVEIGERTIDDTKAATSNIGLIGTLLNGLANMVKSITGETSWRTKPVKTIKQLDSERARLTGDTFTGDVKIDAGLTIRLKVKKSGKDSNGKFTTVEWRRKKDNTLFMRSVLSSPDINGNYQTDTWSIYNAAGTTVIETVTWPLTYDVDGDFVESS